MSEHDDARRTDDSLESSQDPLAPPPLPLVKRLNRNALIIVAALMGITALIAVVTVKTNRQAKAASDVSAIMTTTPAFLDRPPSISPSHMRGLSRDTVVSDVMSSSDTAITLTAPFNQPLPPNLVAPENTDRNGHQFDAGTVGVDPFRRSPGSNAADISQTAYQRALTSPITAARAVSTPDAGTSEPFRTTESAGDTKTPGQFRVADSVTNLSREPTPIAHNAMQLSGGIQYSTVVTLRAGAVIPAMLVSAANSDLPGTLVAQVTRDVFDSQTQHELVVPKGTKVLGHYDTHIATGQQRLMIMWTRLLFPDGQNRTVPDMTAADDAGATGVPGHVDTHTRRLFVNAALLSTISAGLQLSQPQQSDVYAPPSARQIAAGAIGQQFSDVATELIRRNMDIAPTITLPLGQPLNILVNTDLRWPTVDDPNHDRE